MATEKKAKTADRAKDKADHRLPCPQCGMPTQAVKYAKQWRERGVAPGMYRACLSCEFTERL